MTAYDRLLKLRGDIDVNRADPKPQGLILTSELEKNFDSHTVGYGDQLHCQRCKTKALDMWREPCTFPITNC